MICVGIDVAKDKHDCFILSSDGVVLADVFTIPNNLEGLYCAYSDGERPRAVTQEAIVRSARLQSDDDKKSAVSFMNCIWCWLEMKAKMSCGFLASLNAVLAALTNSALTFSNSSGLPMALYRAVALSGTAVANVAL